MAVNALRLNPIVGYLVLRAGIAALEYTDGRRDYGGFALGLSSTTVVIGLIRECNQEVCPVGRAGAVDADFSGHRCNHVVGNINAISAGGTSPRRWVSPD